MSRIIEKKIVVTDENINDIMSSALNGISYWAGEADIIGLKKADDGMWTSDALTNGYRIRIWDAEDSKWHQLTLTKFLKGLKLMDKHDFDDYDSLDGDAVIQYALFGKQVYA